MGITKLNSPIDESDHVYLDLVIGNPFDSIHFTKPARHVENRVQPIIDNPSDYHLSVIRFSIPGFNLPLLRPNIVLNQPNPNKTTWNVSLEYNAAVVTTDVIWEAQVTDVAVPGPVGSKQEDSNYYDLFDYQWFVNLVNKAFVTAFGLLPATPVGSTPPVMTWNADNERFEFYAAIAHYDSVLANPIKVTIGSEMSVLLPGFSYEFNPGLGQRVVFADYHTNTVGAEYVNRQQWNATQYFGSLTGITLATSTIPIVAEYTPTSGIKQGEGVANFKPILTDFAPSLSRAGDGRGVFLYNPTAEYRLIDLIGHQPLRKFDLQIFWTDTNNESHPLTIARGQFINIKIMFRKKSVLKNIPEDFE